MRKMAKVLALALALCMALSVSAFAAVDGGAVKTAEKTVTVTVNLANDSTEQVALLIVNKDLANVASATDADIYFIDQKAATAGGATFTAPIAAEVEEVDIYVGSSTIAAEKSAAFKVGDNVKIVDDAKITIGTTGSLQRAVIKPGVDDVDRAGAAIQVNIPNVKISQMIWSLGNATTRVYTQPFEVSFDTSSINADVWFKGVFNPEKLEAALADAGLTLNDFTHVDVIFLEVKDGGKQVTHYTNEADASNKQ